MNTPAPPASRVKFWAKSAVKRHAPLWHTYHLYCRVQNAFTRARFSRTPAAPWQTESGGEPTLAQVTSQLATARQCAEPQYRLWCDRMRHPPVIHRKQWEHIYILEALQQSGMMAPGKRGLGFGCGPEPIASVLALNGCEIVATDLDHEHAKTQGWVDGHQHAASLSGLNSCGICPNEQFAERVAFRAVDMNAIPADLRDFDFVWSSCALEHLGSLRHGLEFIRNAMQCLRVGGIAVHTTEFNLSSNDDTVESSGLSLYRRQDMERLAITLANQGHYVFPFNWHAGNLGVDAHVDLPPFSDSPHLKLQLERYAYTSIGLIVRTGSSQR